jgi:hypothetical protein
MKRVLVSSLVITLALSNTSAIAAVKIGSSCTKTSTFQQAPQGLLVCDLVKKKKIWRKSTAIEARFYKNDQIRIKKEAQQKLDDAAKAEVDRIAQESQAAADAAAKAALDKAAADAAVKAAADKAAADKAAADAAARAAAAKAAADKAAADAAARAAAAKAAADKAAADAAARAAAEVPNLIVGSLYSGVDADNSGWRWIAVRLTNSSTSKMFTHHFFDVLIGDAAGGIIDSTFEANFPLLGPGQSIWYTTTQFNGSQASQVVFQKKYNTTASALQASELPTTSNARLITSPYLSGKKSVQISVKNNSSQVLSKSSTAYAVLMDASGIPIYAARGFFDKAILPGGTAEIIIGDDFTFNGQVSSIQVTIAPLV